mmetsp:Transcript_28397/g.66110  ORF Transcript_28397/g.66110 Transcript_28397/m.66110 type:complete len:542 (+) Transcript_28397:3-1628(+)
MAGLQPFGMRRVAALALVVVSCNLDGASAFSGSVLGAPGHSLRRSTGAAFSAKPGLSLRPSARRAVLKNLNAVLDPASVHHAADLMQHDWSVAVQYFADASAAALDVVDPSKLSSGVEGTGLTKPFELPFADQIPDIPFPKLNLPKFPELHLWENWMGLLKGTLFKLHDITGSFGVSIIMIVVIIKAITYPLNYKVYASQAEMQLLQPEIDQIKEQYKDNEDLVQMRTTLLFEQTEVNPLAGCLPTLIQFPIFVGLYRTLLNLGKDRALEEPFLFIPSLEGPVVAGLPTDYVGVREDAPWLFQNWADGAPPLGWHDTLIYCIIPVLVVASQIASTQILKKMAPKGEKKKVVKGDGSSETIIALLPFLIGWFSLNLPAGCALYWLVNTTLTTVQQVYIKGLFLPKLELAYAASAELAASSPSAFVTEAEKKAELVANEDGLLRGVKAAYKQFDDFLGTGLPEVPDEKPKEEESGPSVFDSEYWFKKSGGPVMKPEEIDSVKAKFKAAREARLAAKASKAAMAVVEPAAGAPAEAVASVKESE